MSVMFNVFEEFHHRQSEKFLCSVKTGIDNFFPEKPLQPFYQIQLRRVCGQEYLSDYRSLQPLC
jgi:hypothetical protein